MRTQLKPLELLDSASKSPRYQCPHCKQRVAKNVKPDFGNGVSLKDILDSHAHIRDYANELTKASGYGHSTHLVALMLTSQNVYPKGRHNGIALYLAEDVLEALDKLMKQKY